jgi:hypothetical protein
MRHYAAAVTVMLVMGTAPVYAQDTLFVVTMTSADVHKAPSTGSAVVARAPRGKAFEVRRELGSWVSVAWPQADTGVAYLHVAWGRITHGAASQAPRAIGAGLAVPGPASEPLSSTKALEVAQAPGTVPRPAPVMSPVTQRAVSLPSHVIGLGGRMGTRAIGVGATARAWARGSFGVQIEAGQSTFTSAVVPDQLRSMQLAPSIIYSPPNLVTYAIWARPYVGGGINFYRSTLRSTLGGPVAVDNSFGSQVFGGAEFTWANFPQLALSADFREQWAPPTFTGFELGGRGVSLSAHWYLK